MSITHQTKLYKNHGKSIGVWIGESTETGEVIISHSKTLDGKITRNRYQAEPKNVGRSNETSAKEQAELELQSRIKKQLDKGYVHTIDEAKVPATNALGLLKPMLATPLDKVKPEKICFQQAFVQPKLDGHRCLYKDGVLYSRQGKTLDIPHVKEAIEATGLKDFHLDGELYVHGRSLQDISSLIKKYRPAESRVIEYHIYDHIHDQTFYERIMALGDVIDMGGLPATLRAVPTYRVETMSEVMHHHARYRQEGFEGTMLRFGDDPYLTDKRSRTLLKIKEFHDAEFKIIGYKEGKPYITDKGTFQVPVFECETSEGQTFDVTAPGTMEEKHQLWRLRDACVGRLLTVKYHYFSKDGVPQLPTAVRFYEQV